MEENHIPYDLLRTFASAATLSGSKPNFLSNALRTASRLLAGEYHR